jgi:hypothetical protein
LFAAAVKRARGFTRPVVICVALPSGDTSSSAGTFVIVNAEGWVLTAAHMLEQYQAYPPLKQAWLAYEQQLLAIDVDEALNSHQKATRKRKLGAAPADGLRDFGYWWGCDGAALQEAYVVHEADLALCKLSNFDTSAVTDFPVFKDPTKGVDPGTSLCRLGFPFTQAKVGHDASNSFTVDASGMVLFPNDGILTRSLTDASGAEMTIETSTPGLRGQSGGPIFDRDGTVWGIQVHTGHLALGFSPLVPGGKAGEVEHQFLNVGRGSHPRVIVELLESRGIDFQRSTY